jgi:hypothetical protein
VRFKIRKMHDKIILKWDIAICESSENFHNKRNGKLVCQGSPQVHNHLGNNNNNDNIHNKILDRYIEKVECIVYEELIIWGKIFQL